MRRKDDILWKVVMEEVFDDLLRFVFADADKVYDLERGFEFMEKELAELYPEVDKEADTRFADKLVKVFHRDGEEEWVLLHIEIQGDTSRRTEFSERMFRYFYRIFDKYGKPVSAIAIFTGLDGKKMPAQFEYRYRTTRLLYEYHTLSILDCKDEELAESDNPFALVVLAAKTALLEGKVPEQELLKRKLFIASRLLKRGFATKKVRAIFKFLENCIRFEDPEMNRIFGERVQVENKNYTMGIDEYIKMEGIEIGMERGLEKGREEERRVFVENLLTGTDLSDAKIASLANATIEFVNEVKEELGLQA